MSKNGLPEQKKKAEKPFGSWKSPITAEFVTGAKCHSIREVQLDKTDFGRGHVFWLEQLYEAGRGVVYETSVHLSSDQRKQIEWTPYPFSCRNSVHEYGGGCMSAWAGQLWFETVNNVFRQDAHNHIPEPLAPADQGLRFADPSHAHDSLYCVREDQSGVAVGEWTEPRNAIVRFRPDRSVVVKDNAGTHQYQYPQMEVLCEGADFYSSPRVSPDGSKLAWMQWHHPNMPWDATEILLADLAADGGLVKGSARKVLGDGRTNFTEPRWSPHNRLFCISDLSDWWNIYEIDIEKACLGQNVHAMDAEIGLPHWQFGIKSYDFHPNPDSHRVVFTTGKEVFVKDQKSGVCERLETGYSGHTQLCMDADGFVYCVATHPAKPQALIRVDSSTKKTEVIRDARERDSFDLADVSVPEEISFSVASSQELVQAYFYPPKNGAHVGAKGELPPLILQAHGGPTTRANDALDLQKQFFTSRGFALCDVNYRGSTGRGRKSRDALGGRCGVSDVEDVCAAAEHLIGQGRVDPARVCVMGGSHSGYVTLEALCQSQLFKAGVSSYGIGDLEKCHLEALEGHKFESRYFESLIAPYPDEAETFRRRSPLNHPERISAAVAFFHGLDDKVVVPAQAELMYEAVKKKGLPTSLVLFEGEGHGFRQKANVAFWLNGVYHFLCTVLGIESSSPPPDIQLMSIDNLPKKIR